MAFSITASSFERHLHCSICMEVFSDPRALPCMHTFCKACLQSYIISLNSKIDVRSRGIECPVCRNVTYSPAMGLLVEEWAGNFTPNYTVKGLIDEHNETSALQNRCAGGGGNDRQAADVQVCDVHPEKVAEFKCEDHSPTPVLCAVCAVRRHKRCSSLIYLGDDMSSENEDMELNGNIDPALPVTRRRALSNLAHIKLCRAQENQNCNERLTEDFPISNASNWDTSDVAQAVSNPNSHRSLRRLVKNQYSHSFEESEDLRKLSASAPTYDSVHIGSSDNFVLNHNSRDIITTAPPFDMSPYSKDGRNETVQPDSSVDLASEQNEIERDSHPSLRRLVCGAAPHSFNDSEDLRRLSSKNNDRRKHGNSEPPILDSGLRFETATGGTNVTKSRTRSALRKEMSVIREAAEADLEYPAAAAEKYSDVALSMKSVFTLSQKVKIRLDEDSKICCVTGICSMPDGRVLLADYNNYKVKLFDDRGMSKSYITLPSEPWDIDCIGDYEAVVSLPNAMCLFTLIIDNKVTIGRRIDTDRKCYGIVYNSMQFIIACISDIRIFSYNGEFITRILKDKKPIFPNQRSVGSNMRYLCLDLMNSNKLYISDHNRGLVCVTMNDEVLSFHSSSDTVSPQGLTSSQSGIVIVCQAPNRVTLFLVNEHGCCTKDVLTVENAQMVDFNKSDRRLWLSTSDNDTMYIYTIRT